MTRPNVIEEIHAAYARDQQNAGREAVDATDIPLRPRPFLRWARAYYWAALQHPS